ncbi:MAG: substrate-binding domain-containing protein [Actinomycetota bacterium]
MKKHFRWLAVLLAIVLVTAACGSDDDGDEGASDSSSESSDSSSDSASEAVEQTQGGDLTFHMITHSDDGPFWSVVNRGMDAACADLGVTCVWVPGNNDANVMVQGIEGAIGEGTDGIAASLPDPAALVPALQAAVDAGIPVVTLNSGANDYQSIGALTHVGQTEFIAGQAAGNRFNDAGVSHVLCGQQEQNNIGLTERCAGLEDTFSGTVTTDFMDLDADTAAQQAAINAAMAADDSIDGFLGVGPVITMSGVRAAADLGRDVVVGGFDLTPELLGAIEGGDVLFTVDQQQYLQGYLPILTMYLNQTNANVIGGGLPILTGPGFVTADNAADVLALSEAGTR